MQEANFQVKVNVALGSKVQDLFLLLQQDDQQQGGVFPVLLAEVGVQTERRFSFLPSGGRLDLFLVSQQGAR